MSPSKQIDLNEMIKKWGPAFVMMALIFAASSIPSTYMPRFGPYDFSVKKLGHATGYVLLAAAYRRGIGQERKHSAWIALGLAVLYAGSDEFHQSFVSGRTPSIRDVGIDTVGAFLGCLPGIFRQRSR